MKFKLLVAAAALSTPLIASAAGTLSGPFVGGYLATVEGTDSGTEIWAGAPDGYTEKTSPSGMAYGVLGGYNWVFSNNILVGAEADYESRSMDDSSFQAYYGVPDTAFPFKTELTSAYTLQGKFGYAFNNQKTAAYVTAGFASAAIKRTFNDTGIPATVSQSDTITGVVTGIGIEHMFLDSLSVRADYRVTKYDDTTVNVSAMWTNTYEIMSYDETSFRVGASYRF